MVKPMLACKADLTKLKYPVYVSAKLDGVRATVQGGVVLSRTGKPIPNKHVQELFKKYEWCDGELIVGDPKDTDVFQKTTSGVMSVEGTPDVTFYVFDNFKYKTLTYSERYRQLQSYEDSTNVKIVPSFLVFDEATVLSYEQMFLTQGYEGLMIRDINSPYKEGRSTVNEGYLLKLKRFSDAEAKVLKMLPLKREDGTVEETLGALVVSFEISPDVFEILNIGSGFTTAERLEYWNNKNEYIGKIVKFKYFEKGMKDLPRFPIFLGFRDAIDI